MARGYTKAIFDEAIGPIKLTSVRLKCFRRSGLRCVFCGIEGRYFEHAQPNPEQPAHLALYALLGGKPVLMTKDHIVPKSLGGSDCVGNMQTACRICNEAKGNNQSFMQGWARF